MTIGLVKILKVERTSLLLKNPKLDLSWLVNFNDSLYLLNALEIHKDRLLEKTSEIIRTSYNARSSYTTPEAYKKSHSLNFY